MHSEFLIGDGPLGPPPDPSAMMLANLGADMPAEPITTRQLTKADYDYIVRIIDKWWGGPTSALAHPVYFYELGEHAMVAECDDRLVGFLFGFINRNSHNGPTGYVHLVGIDPDFRRRHVGTLLYQGFESACTEAGCRSLKAITTLGNDGSIRFHEALGWLAKPVDDYAGPRRTRVVFTKILEN